MESITEDSILFDEKLEEIFDFLNDKTDIKYEKLPSFIQFKENFSKAGKQGLIGILNLKTDNGDKEVVYKISQYMNYLVDHENTILKSLNDLREYCPHFCKGFGKIGVPLDINFRKTDNPFESSSKHTLDNDVLLMEYVKGKKFYRYLKKKDFSEEIIFSLIKQVVLAISIAQDKKGLTHYDLHSSNILIKRCDPNTCFLYILDEKRKYLVPTYGYYPVIIDFGFGYVKDMDNNPMYAPLSFTDVGFMSDRFDPIADPKLFLVTVSDEVKGYRNSQNGKEFRKLVKNIFKPLKIDWESGWDDVNDISASDYVTNLLEDVQEKSKSNFFKNCGHYCIDIAQKLITLPLEEAKYKKIDKMYKIIMDEYRNIEKVISNDFYNLYIFKNIIDFAHEVKDDYSNGDDKKREKAVKKFKNNILNLLDRLAKFCNPKLDFEKLLCSLLIFAKKMGGILYEVMSERMKTKSKEYKKLKINRCEEMYELIEANIPSEFDLNENTNIYVWDCVNEISKKTKITKTESDEVNETHPLSRGEVLFDIIKNQKTELVNDLEDDFSVEDEDDDFDEEDEDFDDEDDDEEEDEQDNEEEEKDDYDINKKDSDFDFSDDEDENPFDKSDLSDEELAKILAKY